MMHYDGMDYGDGDEVDGKMLYLMFGCGQQCPREGGGQENIVQVPLPPITLFASERGELGMCWESSCCFQPKKLGV